MTSDTSNTRGTTGTGSAGNAAKASAPQASGASDTSNTRGATGADTREAPAHVPLRRNRDFRLLWTGQAVSDLGSQMSVISYPLLILAVTGSAARAGLVGSATMVGTLLTLLPAGVVADRYSRRRILVIGSLVQLVTVGSVVPAVLAHHVYLAHLMAVGLLQGSAAAFYLGASQGAVRRIVTAGQLPEAMALTQARGQAASMIGPPVGGVLFSLARALPFAFDSVSFGAITLGAALLRDPLDPVARDRPREPARSAVTRGLRHLLAQPFLRMAAIWAAAVNAIAAGMLLMVIVIARERGADAIVIGAMVAANAACGLAGSLFGTRLARRFGVRLWVLATSWLLPCCAVGIAFAPWVWLITMLGAVTTFTVMPAGVFFIAHAARITPDDLQAQTANARQLLGSSLSWLAPPVFGGLTDGIGARDAILIAAALYLATALWLRGRPELGELGDV